MSLSPSVFSHQMRRQKVLPNTALSDLTDVAFSDAVFFPGFNERPSRVENLDHLLLCKPSAVVIFSHRSQFRTSNKNVVDSIVDWRRFMPAFCYAIVVIVSMRSQKKMLGIYARRVIASMQNFQSFWNRPNEYLKRISMSKYVSFICKPENAVTKVVSRAIPLPTFIRSCLLEVRQKLTFQAAKTRGAHRTFEQNLANIAWSDHAFALPDWRVT